MKKIFLLFSLALLMGVSNTANAQNISINVSFNINKQPAWGPTGYEYANFYFFPDLNIYFDVNNSLFYYQSGSKWIYNRYLPNKYSKYDLYSLYKIVINDDAQPWQNHKTYKNRYSGYKGNKTQTPIRYSNENKYSNSKGNSIVWVDNNNFEKKDKNSSKNNQSSQNNNGGQKQNNNNNSKGRETQSSSQANSGNQKENNNSSQSANRPQTNRK